MINFTKTRWHSDRMKTAATLCRWGHFGQPVLIFPTAGGDAEEIERFLMIRVLEPLISAGKIKVYSCDSVAGQGFMRSDYSPQHKQWLTSQFHQYVRFEVVPAIHQDCGAQLPIWTTGASIGAFHAVASLCRFPDVFERALGMSGSYNILRFIDNPPMTPDFYLSSPLHFLPGLQGPMLDLLRTRFVLLASGAGKAENMGESWAMARTLGAKGIPNRVDPWGPDVEHDWMTWRAMLPKYLGEWTG